MGRASLLQFLKLRDSYFPIPEHSADFQRPAQRFNILGKRAQIEISPMLNLRHFALIHSQAFREPGLRHLPSPAQFVERHRGNRFADTLIYSLPTFGWYGVKQFTKISSRHDGWIVSFSVLSG